MCERFGRWGETGEKINVSAFYTSWSGFADVVVDLAFEYHYSSQIVYTKEKETNVLNFKTSD